MLKTDRNQVPPTKLIIRYFFYLPRIIPTTTLLSTYLHDSTIRFHGFSPRFHADPPLPPSILFPPPHFEPHIDRPWRTFIFDKGRTPTTIKPFDRGRLSAIGGLEGWFTRAWLKRHGRWWKQGASWSSCRATHNSTLVGEKLIGSAFRDEKLAHAPTTSPFSPTTSHVQSPFVF